MSYATIADLPDSIKSVLPSGAQNIFRSTFNSAYSGTCKGRSDLEACANTIAWSAVKKKYTKSGDKWVSAEQKETVHDAILQTLNREIDGYCFPADAFEKNVKAWDGIPVVYADDHPNMSLFVENQQKALDEIKGQIVGRISNPYIATDGHPRLMAGLTNTNKDVARLIRDGKLSLSTGFKGISDDNYRIKEVVPNHVLVFREDLNNMPKDHGAFILNKDTYIEFSNKGEFMSETITDKIKNPIIELYNAVMGGSSQEEYWERDNSHTDDTTKEVEMKEMIELSNKLKTAEDSLGDVTSKLDIANKEIATKDTKISELEAKVKDFEQKEEAAEKLRKDALWIDVKNKLPPGVTHGEKEAVVRAEWNTDPYTFTAKYIGITNKADPTQEEGIEFSHNTGSDDDDLKLMEDVNSRLGRVR